MNRKLLYILVFLLIIVSAQIGVFLGMSLVNRKKQSIPSFQVQRCDINTAKKQIQKTLKPGETFDCFKYPFNFDPSMGLDEKKFFMSKFFSGIIQESIFEATYKGIINSISRENDSVFLSISNNKDSHDFFITKEDINKIKVIKKINDTEEIPLTINDLKKGDELLIKSRYRYLRKEDEIVAEILQFIIEKQ